MMHKRRQGSAPIRYIRRGHCDCVGQSLRINRDMALDSRNLLASVISLTASRISIFDALRINDTKRRLFFAAKADAGRANRIFLKPAPAGLIRLPRLLRSSEQNTSTPYSNEDIRSAACATGSRFSVHTALHKTPRIDQLALAWLSYAPSPVSVAPFQIAPDLRHSDIFFSLRKFTRLFDERQKDRKQVLSKWYKHDVVEHSKEYSTSEGINQNQAESFFSRLRCAEIGTFRGMRHQYFALYAHEMAWREDTRHLSLNAKFVEILAILMRCGLSGTWRGYNQGHRLQKEHDGLPTS